MKPGWNISSVSLITVLNLLPPGIHDNRNVLRKWFEERVFIEDEFDEKANKFTTYRGGVTTFKALRENRRQRHR